MRRAMVVANWKMHGNKDSIRVLVKALRQKIQTQAEVLLLPPSIYLDFVQQELQATNWGLGLQNICHSPGDGSFTGEISASMAADMGCCYALVGHSERRVLFKETNEVVASKFKNALAAGLKPILCVGETLEQREKDLTEQVIAEQLAFLTTALPSNKAELVVAYEPVWAIGTGVSATAEQAQLVHAMIRQKLQQIDSDLAARTPLLYGGSVKADNAIELFAQADIDGGLIGSASLVDEQFTAISQAAG